MQSLGGGSLSDSEPEKEGIAGLFRRRGKTILISTIVILVILIWLGLQPIKGTVHLGICRTFIELQLPYPKTLQLTAIESLISKNYGDVNLRLYFTHIDAFGQNRSETFECFFGPNLEVLDLKRNRKSLPADQIKKLGYTVPFIASANPDRILPARPTSDLMSLKRD